MSNSGKKLTELQEQLLRRILTSRQFAHADILKRILRYLADRSADPKDQAPKEYEIAVGAMGRAESFDARLDPVVRVSLGSVRERLQSYFATEGISEPIRIEIPKGQYRAYFVEAPRVLGPPSRMTFELARFWEPYITGHLPNIIVYTEPLFFRADNNRFVRDWNVNSVAEGDASFRDSFLGLNTCELSPVFHYLSAGEMRCLLSITRMFHEMRVPVETRNSRNSSWQELSNANLILLGSPRTNEFLASLQGLSPLVIRPDRVEQNDPEGRVVRNYAGKRFKDGNLPRMTEYALVARRRGLKNGSAITMIAANHGGAIEAAGHQLTLDDKVADILQRINAQDTNEVAESFQLLMKVEMMNIDDQVLSVDCIEHFTHPG